eukprot:jgi/Ulvmu1/7442/UM036_0104.1
MYTSSLVLWRSQIARNVCVVRDLHCATWLQIECEVCKYHRRLPITKRHVTCGLVGNQPGSKLLQSSLCQSARLIKNSGTPAGLAAYKPCSSMKSLVPKLESIA